MGVAGQIGEHLLGACERTLGINHPFASAQRCEVRSERVRIFQADKIAEKLKVAGKVQRFETF